jgi:hypothetical protein
VLLSREQKYKVSGTLLQVFAALCLNNHMGGFWFPFSILCRELSGLVAHRHRNKQNTDFRLLSDKSSLSSSSLL